MSLEPVRWVGESSDGITGLLLAVAHPERIASLVLCNTPTRISDEIKGIYALDRGSTTAAIRAHGTGEWCRRTLRCRLDIEHASEPLREWCIAEMDKTHPDIAAAKPLLPQIVAPVVLLSGDKSRIASEQQKILAASLPHGESSCDPGPTRSLTSPASISISRSRGIAQARAAPHPPVWMAVSSEGAIDWAAGHGFSILMDPHSSGPEIGIKRRRPRIATRVSTLEQGDGCALRLPDTSFDRALSTRHAKTRLLNR